MCLQRVTLQQQQLQQGFVGCCHGLVQMPQRRAEEFFIGNGGDAAEIEIVGAGQRGC